MDINNRYILRLVITKHMRIKYLDIPQRLSEHKVQIDFQISRLTCKTLKCQTPLASCMFAGNSSNCKTFTGEYSLNSLLDFRTFRKHLVPIKRTNIVQINIYG